MVAAVAAVAAVVFAVLALRPVPEGTLVAVAKTDLAPGAQITRHQLRVVAVPPGAVPQGASDQVGRFVGVAPTRAVDAGTVVTDQVLGVGAGADPLPSGYAQAVVPLAEDSVLVEPGNTLEVWGPSPECATQDCPILRLADNVQVAQVSTTESSALSGPGNALVTVNLPANSVGPVLHAVQSGSVHFVRSG